MSNLIINATPVKNYFDYKKKLKVYQRLTSGESKFVLSSFQQEELAKLVRLLAEYEDKYIPTNLPNNSNLFYYPLNKDRKTVAGIISSDGTEIHIGFVNCSVNEPFVKVIGRNLALREAIFNPVATIPVIGDKPRKSFITAVKGMFPDNYKVVTEVYPFVKGIKKKGSKGNTPFVRVTTILL